MLSTVRDCGALDAVNPREERNHANKKTKAYPEREESPDQNEQDEFCQG